MDKIKKGRLEWFLDFINLDLGTLSPGEVIKISTEISLIKGGESMADSNTVIEWAYQLLHEWYLSKGNKGLNLEGCQERLRGFVTNMFSVISEASKPVHFTDIESGEKTLIVKNQLSLKHILGNIETPVIIEASFDLPSDLEGLDDRVIKTFYKTTNLENNLLIYFMQALDGVPIGAIRQCPECGNWFLHISKRVKLFCSNKCASKKVSREKRERLKSKDPEAYNQELKTGAKRARKSYEKKVKQKNPVAKIARRPRKHK